MHKCAIHGSYGRIPSLQCAGSGPPPGLTDDEPDFAGSFAHGHYFSVRVMVKVAPRAWLTWCDGHIGVLGGSLGHRAFI